MRRREEKKRHMQRNEKIIALQCIYRLLVVNVVAENIYLCCGRCTIEFRFVLNFVVQIKAKDTFVHG